MTKNNNLISFGFGIAQYKEDKLLDVYYPHIHWKSDKELFENILSKDLGLFKIKTNHSSIVKKNQLALICKAIEKQKKECVNIKWLLNYKKILKSSKKKYQEKKIIFTAFYNTNSDIENGIEAYYRLHCISMRYCKPHSLNLKNIFSILNNIAWTNQGPILPEDVAKEKNKNISNQIPFQVYHIDKFPYLIDYFIPSGVRITKSSAARLGAYLSSGTTIMPSGYVNFNAGTLGNAMVEGRISAGVVVGKDTDIGGGASIMGTLSGGNNEVISIGEKCLLGANAGIGISLGDGCTVAAGVYVTAGAKVWLYDEKKNSINLKEKKVDEGKNIVKAKELDGVKNKLFLVDSTNGHLICLPNKNQIKLNKQLHKKN